MVGGCLIILILLVWFIYAVVAALPGWLIIVIVAFLIWLATSDDYI